jgi:hypothetical protein
MAAAKHTNLLLRIGCIGIIDRKTAAKNERE